MKKIFFIFILLSIFSISSYAAIAFDAVSVGTIQNNNTVTWAHTCAASAAGTNTLLLVGIIYSVNQINTRCTYNGIGMQLIYDTHNGATETMVFALLNPTSDGSAHNILLVCADGSYARACAVSYTGVVGFQGVTSGGATVARSLTITANVQNQNSWLIGGFMGTQSADYTPTVTSNGTVRGQNYGWNQWAAFMDMVATPGMNNILASESPVATARQGMALEVLAPSMTPNMTQTIAVIQTAVVVPTDTPIPAPTLVSTATPIPAPTNQATVNNTTVALAVAAASYTPVPQATANVTIPVIVASVQTISAQLSYTPTPATNINWAEKTAGAVWGARDSFATVWDGTKISVIGGFCALCGWKSGYENDVWQSTDGATWTGTTLNAQFSARSREGAVYFNNQFWIFGGLSGGTAKVNDVWYSSNGSAWGCTTTAAAWTIRQWPVSIVYNNKIWLISGTDDESPYSNLNPSDAWYSSDGANWTAATRNAAFPGRQLAASTIYNNSIWIFGGENISNTTYYNDAWYSSDGANWTAATRNAAYAATDSLFAGIYNGSLFIYDGTTSYVWQSTDGATWTQITGFNSPPTRRESGGFIKSNNFFVIGGYSGAADVNDVWDGTINYTIAAGTVTPANTATPQYTATPDLRVPPIQTTVVYLGTPPTVVPAVNTATPDLRVPPIQTTVVYLGTPPTVVPALNTATPGSTPNATTIALAVAAASYTPPYTPTLVPTATLVWTATPPPNLTCIVCGAYASPTSTLPGTVTVTPTITQTATHWPTPSFTMTFTFTFTITPTPTFTMTNTFTPTFTLTSIFTKTFTQTITPNVTTTATATITPQTAIAPADLKYSSNDLYYEYFTSIYYLPSGTRSPNLTTQVKQLSLSIIVVDYFTNTCEVISRTPLLYKYSFETYIQQMVGNNWWIITPTPTPG